MDIPQIINRKDASTGEMGQEYLISGKNVDLRRWDESRGNEQASEPHTREYETVGYLLSGKLEIEVDGQKGTLHPGDSWLVPARASHRYRVLEDIVAIEATSPPARFADRDE